MRPGELGAAGLPAAELSDSDLEQVVGGKVVFWGRPGWVGLGWA
jgi:hypothetical protein